MSEIQPNLNETVSPREIFSLVTGLVELLQLIVEQFNLYAHQNGGNFTVTKEELKAFLGKNFVMAISKLPMIRDRFGEILQNLHFADNRRMIKQTRLSR